MARIIELTWQDIYSRAANLSNKINITFPKVYAIPRGGIPAALALDRYKPLYMVTKPEEADCFIDDIIASGKTRDYYQKKYNKPFFALIPDPEPFVWYVFPWEIEDGKDKSHEDIFVRLIEYVGEDPNRQGLIETPKRMAKAWKEWTSGYAMNEEDILKTFEDGAENYDQMITVKDIPIYSHCEHHLAAIIGTATISYIPDRRIVGLSKLVRLADMFARRLQVQERLTTQIADALFEHLEPLGVGVIIKARHMCMESRGVCKPGTETVTTALRGNFFDPKVKKEFLCLAGD